MTDEQIRAIAARLGEDIGRAVRPQDIYEDAGDIYAGSLYCGWLVRHDQTYVREAIGPRVFLPKGSVFYDRSQPSAVVHPDGRTHTLY